MFGLPLHPLVVHGAIVLVPLTAIAIIAALGLRQWKGVVPVAIATLAVAGAVFAWLAANSGEPLEDFVEDRADAAGVEFETEDHEEQGEQAYNLAVIFAVAVVVLAAAERLMRLTVPPSFRRSWMMSHDRKPLVLYASLAAVAVLGIVASWRWSSPATAVRSWYGTTPGTSFLRERNSDEIRQHDLCGLDYGRGPGLPIGHVLCSRCLGQ